MNKITKWWKRRNFNLRQSCIDKYTKEFGQEFGKDFGEKYDKVCNGEPIGDFAETMAFLIAVEKVKEESGLY